MVFSDFAALPPEVISTQIYTGPGAGSLLAAAAAWEGLAAELHSTAASYGSVISELVGESWQGQSSESMAAAAEPYVAWMSATAGQAEETAAQARAAASAYEAALAATVPPVLVAANRSQLAALLETNILGRNDEAIAAAEDEYGQMWAQDVAAMFSYASASESAGELTVFEEAPATTNATGQVTQAAGAPTAGSQSLSSWLKQLEDYITSLTGQYTQFWQSLIGGATGSTEIAPFWETLYSSIGQVGTQATWTNVVNASSSLGISQWKNFFIYSPWAAAMSKTSLGDQTRLHRATGHQRGCRRCGRYLRWPGQRGDLGQSGGRRAGQPGVARRQLNRHPGPRDHRRAPRGARQARPHHRPTAGDARPSPALERRRGRPR
jgi:PPE-repeat protein